MNRLRAGWITAVVMGMSLPAAAQTTAACDRACLTALLDQYVETLVARQPSRLSLSPTVTFTENGQRLDLGDGLWHTGTDKGNYRLAMADVEAGQAVLMGTIREAGVPTIFVLRLGVVNLRIAEIETLVIRNQTAAESLDRIATPRRTWTAAVPESERQSRDELVRIANMYFSGIELNDGKGVYPSSRRVRGSPSSTTRRVTPATARSPMAGESCPAPPSRGPGRSRSFSRSRRD